MKIRSGFVSNSSSSSFICDFCREELSGWDMYPTYTCVNDHRACEVCDPSSESLSDEQRVEIAKECFEEQLEEYKDIANYTWLTESERRRRIAETQGILDNLSPDSYDEIEWDGKHPASTCPICRLEDYAEDELCMYLYRKYNVSRDDVFAKIKAENKRRRKLYDSEYITHVCTTENITIQQLLQEIREKFVIWEAYNDYLSQGEK